MGRRWRRLTSTYLPKKAAKWTLVGGLSYAHRPLSAILTTLRSHCRWKKKLHVKQGIFFFFWHAKWPKLGAKWMEKWPKLMQKWPKVDPKLTQKYFFHGHLHSKFSCTKLMEKWPKLMQKWPKVDAKVTQSWPKKIFFMQKWPKVGQHYFSLDAQWSLSRTAIL